jgi:alpha-amylase
LKFALLIHHHQPSGNLTEGVRAAFADAYEPVLRALEMHAGVRVNLHFSGSLLEWLEAHEPDFLARVRTLGSRAEHLSGAMHEPLLAMIPREDAVAQIGAHWTLLERLFGVNARGLYLTEFAWEPHLSALINSTGLEWLPLPLAQFPPATKPGVYITEEQGKPVRVVTCAHPDLERAPLLPDGEFACLALNAEELAGRIAWLEALLKLLEREETVLLSDHLDATVPERLVYLPSSRALHGGSWREAVLEHAESDHLHKRAAYASSKLNAVFRVPEEAHQHLWRAQSGLAYWRAGVSKNYLRFHAYQSLIRAENILEPRKYAWLEIAYRDLNLDGAEDIIAEAHTMNLYFNPRVGGQLVEFDDRPRAVNLIDSFTPHSVSSVGLSNTNAPYPRRALVDHFLGAEDTTLEDFARGKYLELGDFTTGAFEAGRYRDRVTLSRLGSVRGPLGVPVPVEVKKAVRLKPKEGCVDIEYRLHNHGDWDIVARFASEWNFSLLEGDSPRRYYQIGSERVGTLNAQLEHRDVTQASLVDELLDLRVTFEFPREVTLWTHPVYSVEGKRKQYQSSAVLPLWDLDLPKGRSRRLTYSVRVSSANE